MKTVLGMQKTLAMPALPINVFEVLSFTFTLVSLRK